MTSPAVRPATLPVLLIEDEPSIMALVSATLERNGYEVAASSPAPKLCACWKRANTSAWSPTCAPPAA